MTAVALYACCERTKTKENRTHTFSLSIVLPGGQRHNCTDTHSPFSFGEILLELLADGAVNVLRRGSVPGNPGMAECLSTCKPFFYIDADQMTDEVLSRFADVIPIGRVELEVACECR